jgi:hypothetical protein
VSKKQQLFWSGLMRRLSCPLLTAFVLLPLICQGAAAQTTQQQFWPETDFFLRIKPRVRGDFIVARSRDAGNNRSAELGPDIEFYFRRFVKDRIKTNNTANQQLLTFRVGYHYLAGVGQPSENRAIVQGTSRFPLGWSLLLADRNRFDFRWVQGKPFGWRYRNRLMLERSFKVKRVSFTPYTDGEIIWSSTTQSWNQILFDLGATFPIRKWLEFTPYYERYAKRTSPATYTNAVGFTTAFYFSRRGASN